MNQTLPCWLQKPLDELNTTLNDLERRGDWATATCLAAQHFRTAQALFNLTQNQLRTFYAQLDADTNKYLREKLSAEELEFFSALYTGSFSAFISKRFTHSSALPLQGDTPCHLILVNATAQSQPQTLLQTVQTGLPNAPTFHGIEALTQQLKQQLMHLQNQGITPVIVVQHAQHLNSAALISLKRLRELTGHTGVVLLGTTELSKHIAACEEVSLRCEVIDLDTPTAVAA